MPWTSTNDSPDVPVTFELRRRAQADRRNVKKQISLLRGDIGRAFRRHPRPVVAVFLHQQTYVLQGSIQFVERVEFPKLKFGGIDDLVGIGMAGSAFHINRPHEEIKRSHEASKPRRCQRG